MIERKSTEDGIIFLTSDGAGFLTEDEALDWQAQMDMRARVASGLARLSDLVPLENPHGTEWRLLEAKALTADDGDYRIQSYYGGTIGGFRATAEFECEQGYRALYFWHPATGWELGAN